MNKKPLESLILLFLLLAACNQSQQIKEEKAGITPPETANGLFLSNDQLANAGIVYGKLELHQLSSDVNARGQLVLPVNAITDLVSLYPGIINEVFVRNGEKVSMGKILASLSSPFVISRSIFSIKS